MTSRAVLWLLLALAAAVAAMLSIRYWAREQRLRANLVARISQIQPLRGEIRVPCAEIVARRPLVLLALGQSNAGNHGALSPSPLPPITLVTEGQCVQASDPLPGATGHGGSIWQRLPTALREKGWTQPVVISVLAVDATSIDEWTRPDSPLPAMLTAHLQSLHRLQLTPDYLFWQQGEADAQAGTSADDYGARLDRLAAIIHDAGHKAPILLARTTVCRSPANEMIRASIQAKVAKDARFRLGPDTDTLTAESFRHDGCHLSVAGLDRAARLWADVITATGSAPRPDRQSADGSAPR